MLSLNVYMNIQCTYQPQFPKTAQNECLKYGNGNYCNYGRHARYGSLLMKGTSGLLFGGQVPRLRRPSRTSTTTSLSRSSCCRRWETIPSRTLSRPWRYSMRRRKLVCTRLGLARLGLAQLSSDQLGLASSLLCHSLKIIFHK